MGGGGRGGEGRIPSRLPTIDRRGMWATVPVIEEKDDEPASPKGDAIVALAPSFADECKIRGRGLLQRIHRTPRKGLHIPSNLDSCLVDVAKIMPARRISGRTIKQGAILDHRLAAGC